MTTIAHISDIHLAPLPRVLPWQLLNKRITGYVNWQLKRRGQICPDAGKNLVDHLLTQPFDLSVVSGDLVNLALAREMQTALAWLKRLGSPQHVCMVPGNHDAYLPGSLHKALGVYDGYATGETLTEAPFPYVRRVGQVAVIGCNSAIATPPFFAAGYFGKEQGERLSQCLQILKSAGLFRIVTIHHPPAKELERPYRKGLLGAALFRKIIKENGAELVLHGHTHKSSMFTIDGSEKKVPVIGVAAASTCPVSNAPPARYNLFHIEKHKHRWSCTMREFGYQRVGEGIVQRLQLRIC